MLAPPLPSTRLVNFFGVAGTTCARMLLGLEVRSSAAVRGSQQKPRLWGTAVFMRASVSETMGPDQPNLMELPRRVSGWIGVPRRITNTFWGVQNLLQDEGLLVAGRGVKQGSEGVGVPPGGKFGIVRV